VDAGDMLAPRAVVSDKEEQQRKIKAELLIEATTSMGMDGLTVGEGDLAFGLDWLQRIAAKHHAPYLSANLRNDETGQLVFPTSKVVKKGPYTLGLTAVTLDTIPVTAGRIDDPKAALTQAVAELRAQNVDFVVALVHTNFDLAQQLAADVPGIDLMFTGHGRRHQEDPVIVGRTAIFEAGSRAKHVGEVRIDLREGGAGWSDPEGRERVVRQKAQLEQQLAKYDAQIAAEQDASSRTRIERVRTFTVKKLEDLVVPPEDDGKGHTLRGRRVPMSRDIVDDPTIGKLVDSYLALLGPGNSGHRVKDAVATAERLPEAKARASYGDYVTARSCLTCHPTQHSDWMRTPHARAWASLVKDRRHFDLDCWSCHVTGAGKPGGPTSPADVGPLKNVQCEACHGPGKPHTETPTKENIVRSPGEAVCVACHTEEQTEGRFVYSEYLPKVDHVD
jgi:predicted CXXCH cytochrome family protein